MIVGGGPAGLNAALTRGRARRRGLLVDGGGQPRNAPAQAVHGFLSRDGLAPAELRRIGREQLAPYPSVEVRDSDVLDVQPIGEPAGSSECGGIGLLSLPEGASDAGAWVPCQPRDPAVSTRAGSKPMPSITVRRWAR